MKKIKKLSVFLLMLMLCIMTSVPVMAATSSVEQDGLKVSLTTDKEEYSDGEEILLTLKVENTNDQAVSDLKLENVVSDGYELTADSIQKLKELVELGAGQGETLTLTAVKADDKKDDNQQTDDKKDDNQQTDDKKDDNQQTDDKKDDNQQTDDKKDDNQQNADNQKEDKETGKGVDSPKTGDSNSVLVWSIVCFAAIVGIVIVQAVKGRRGKNMLSLLLCTSLAASTLLSAAVSVSAADAVKKSIAVEKTVKYAGKDVTFKMEISYMLQTEDDSASEVEPADEYKLVWSDEFEGTELNRDDWNVELHDPGWVNAEWQEYVDSEENIYLEDGKLVIKPVKTVDENGEAHYTSGRINTQNKQTFTYGKFEARVKVPEGKGYLPAFWLMSNDENLYGQWPRCGEIDIMEVLGDKPNAAHGTIHYGNPHSQSQGTYELEDGTFADDFHTFSVEWEPGKISWYMDGILYHTESDWYSATEGQGEITYPAPFDQPFYVILNLAVGGSWVGYPDDTTDFENAAYEVDYVRVYQKDSYDENVQKPVKEVILRDPDANGNYIVNGDFAVAEDLADDKDWSFLLANGGEANAEINNNEMVINSTNAGTVDYSVQLVQPNLPMQKGATYKLTFDAYADEARTMIVDISAPDRNYVRYLADTKVNLTTEKQTFTYEFTMTSDDDANGRLEFNLGNQGSVAGVKISNVKLEKTAFEEIKEDDTKTVLADGNYVYNGSFQEGENRLGYWNITNNAGAEISVTNLDDNRKLKIVAPEGTSAENPVIISQSGLALTDGSNYAFSIFTQGEEGTNISVTVAGSDKFINLHGVPTTIEETFTAVDNSSKDLVFTITEPGTFYLDDIRIVEDSLIKNGSFSAGFAGFEPFVDSSLSSEVTYVVDSLNEDNAADYTINNTGTQDWLIQLKQENITLEKGQWYRLTLDAKSSIDRKFMVALQRNGNIHKDDWTPYCQETVDLTKDYQTFVFEFPMTEETDTQSVLSISMGAVGGTQITQQHRVVIDNINLEKIDAPEQEEIVAGTNLIQNPVFANEGENWKKSILDPGTVTFGDGSVTFDIKDVGVNDYDVQLKTFGIPLEKGESYKVSFKASSTADREISVNVMSKSYAWYGGKSAQLTSEPQTFDFTFDMKEDNLDAGLFFSMGKIENVDTPASTITISEVSVVKLDASAETPEVGDADEETGEDEAGDENIDEDEEISEAVNLIVNGDFTDGTNAWETNFYETAKGTATSNNNNAIVYEIEDLGTANWNIQLKQTGLTLEEGATYMVSFDVTSTAARKVEFGFFPSTDSSKWCGGGTVELNANEMLPVSMDVTMSGDANDFVISLGKITDTDVASTITIGNVSIIKK